MDPISLNRSSPEMSNMGADPVGYQNYPHVWLDNLQEVDIPEEGEIRFRYSRKKKIETETKDNETTSVELCLKAITDICECEGKEDDGLSEPDNMPSDSDAESALDRIMKELGDEDMEDESEDDNPSKY